MGSTPDLLLTLFDSCRRITTLNLWKTYVEVTRAFILFQSLVGILEYHRVSLRWSGYAITHEVDLQPANVSHAHGKNVGPFTVVMGCRFDVIIYGFGAAAAWSRLSCFAFDLARVLKCVRSFFSFCDFPPLLRFW